MKTLILLLFVLVAAALGTHFSEGSLKSIFQTVLFVTAGISAVALATGMTD
ncbi:MAG: hypothetical protein U0936_06640 [Planctomycetaceae bacterium]